MASMRKEYGAKKGKSVFYATAAKQKQGRPVSHKGSLRKAVKSKGHRPHQVSPFYKRTHRTYNV